MDSTSPKKSQALIAFGANQGDCEAALTKAVEALENEQNVLDITCSKAIRTKAVTGESPNGESPNDSASQHQYLNAAIRVLTTWTPFELHKAMIRIEKELGREREHRWGPRTIDLDLLLVGDLQLRSDDLIVPHPRMSFRRFVLQPALDIAPDMVHPESGMTLQQLVDHLDKSGMHVVLATNDYDTANLICQKAACEVRIVSNVLQFMTQAGNARLVVSLIDESKIDEEAEKLMRFAYNFAGPSLRLDQTLGVDMAAKELAAAFQAMQ